MFSETCSGTWAYSRRVSPNPAVLCMFSVLINSIVLGTVSTMPPRSRRSVALLYNLIPSSEKTLGGSGYCHELVGIRRLEGGS